MITAGIDLSAPEGAAWEFFVLFLVVILGPPLVQRFKIPGLIGLLLGGFLIGSHGLGLLDDGSTTIPDLGQLGLLYLMFVAGVELDLNLLKRHRNSAISFGVITFAFPMAFGTAVGVLLDWEIAAALLLGSLLASHTLVLYPLIRGAGLANDHIVAGAVGATVLTDTLALVILAIIAGTTSGTGTGAEIAIQLVLGLGAIIVLSFLILPWLAKRAVYALGAEGAVRYVIVVAGFLASAVMAETFGIEGIVGAFFAGLGLNRFVPNEGPLMGRIDFFGSALFVPVFLVSIGLLLEPSVMVQGETLGLAGLFILACMGGKMIAAQLTRPLFGATGPQALVAFALTAPQAAATLASTAVGFKLGLFGESVVNAVLILIFVSILVATLVAESQIKHVELPGKPERNIGERVLVEVHDMEAAHEALLVARATADKDAGVVEVVLMRPPDGDLDAARSDLDRLRGICVRMRLDTEPLLNFTPDARESSVHAAMGHDASLVIVATMDEDGWDSTFARNPNAPPVMVSSAREPI